MPNFTWNSSDLNELGQVGRETKKARRKARNPSRTVKKFYSFYATLQLTYYKGYLHGFYPARPVSIYSTNPGIKGNILRPLNQVIWAEDVTVQKFARRVRFHGLRSSPWQRDSWQCSDKCYVTGSKGFPRDKNSWSEFPAKKTTGTPITLKSVSSEALQEYAPSPEDITAT